MYRVQIMTKMSNSGRFHIYAMLINDMWHCLEVNIVVLL